ncbi:hypothetical protein SOVF_099360 [Spinacia oleracea]|nr:hypothetical protein SOVF_099360 [Spinacia oleracea]
MPNLQINLMRVNEDEEEDKDTYGISMELDQYSIHGIAASRCDLCHFSLLSLLFPRGFLFPSDPFKCCRAFASTSTSGVVDISS